MTTSRLFGTNMDETLEGNSLVPTSHDKKPMNIRKLLCYPYVGCECSNCSEQPAVSVKPKPTTEEGTETETKMETFKRFLASPFTKINPTKTPTEPSQDKTSYFPRDIHFDQHKCPEEGFIYYTVKESLPFCASDNRNTFEPPFNDNRELDQILDYSTLNAEYSSMKPWIGFDDLSEREPERIILQDNERSLSCLELKQLIRAIAASLDSLCNIKPGSKTQIAICARNSIAWVAVQHAVTWFGNQLAPLFPQWLTFKPESHILPGILETTLNEIKVLFCATVQDARRIFDLMNMFREAKSRVVTGHLSHVIVMNFLDKNHGNDELVDYELTFQQLQKDFKHKLGMQLIDGFDSVRDGQGEFLKLEGPAVQVEWDDQYMKICSSGSSDGYPKINDLTLGDYVELVCANAFSRNAMHLFMHYTIGVMKPDAGQVPTYLSSASLAYHHELILTGVMFMLGISVALPARMSPLELQLAAYQFQPRIMHCLAGDLVEVYRQLKYNMMGDKTEQEFDTLIDYHHLQLLGCTDSESEEYKRGEEFFKEMRDSFGGNVHLLLVGGDHCSESVLKFFHCLLKGYLIVYYACSEFGGSIISTYADQYDYKTIGFPLDHLNIKVQAGIPEDSHTRLAVKSSRLLYLKNWFESSDYVSFNNQEKLELKGSAFVARLSRTVRSISFIESVLAGLPWIRQIFIDFIEVKNQGNVAYAIVFPCDDRMPESIRQMQIQSKIEAAGLKIIEQYGLNKGLDSSDIPKYLFLTNEAFSFENGCLTPTGTFVRDNIEEAWKGKVQACIDQITP